MFYVPRERTIFSQCLREAVLGTFSPCNLSRLRQGAASPMEVEGELPDMNAEEMAKEGFYLVKSVIGHRYRQGWRLLTL